MYGMVHGCAVLDVCTDGILMTKRPLGTVFVCWRKG